MANRDIVVIGASAGGINALLDLVGALPPLPAALFVVVHTSPEPDGLLPKIIERSGSWKAAVATDGSRIRHGLIHVAPPDCHLLLRRSGIRVVRGPRENRFRPAIDPLFRTAAETYGSRVIGIVLSGGLDDGTHGLELIKRHGGIAIVQDPEEAIQPSMPLSALRHVEVDHILRAGEIGETLSQLVAEEVEVEPHDNATKEQPDVAEGTAQNEKIAEGRPPSPFTCPECGGALWELEGGSVLRYRCHVGHGYTADSLLVDQSDSLENAMWAALRALEEHGMLRRRLAEHALQSGRRLEARTLELDAKATELRASTIRRLLREGQPGQPHDDDDDDASLLSSGRKPTTRRKPTNRRSGQGRPRNGRQANR